MKLEFIFEKLDSDFTLESLNEIINIRSNEKNKKWQEISNSWIDTEKN